MPLQLPNLDDRTYNDLIAEALSLIPTYAPDWTNHNPSDPGITLIELLAYLTEMLIYRQNRVTDANVRSFLKLLNGPEWQPSATSPEALAEDVRATVLRLRQPDRAVSFEDFESLALALDERVARARCLPRRNLQVDFETPRAGHVGLIVVPKAGHEWELAPDKFHLWWRKALLCQTHSESVALVLWFVGCLYRSILEKVEAELEMRRLLTTKLHVVGPQYVSVQVRVTVVPFADAVKADIQERTVTAVNDFLHPLEGGKEARGWPFGRNVFVAEIYELLDRLPGIDYVTAVDLNRVATATNIPQRLIRDRDRLIGIEVKPYELVKLQMSQADVTVDFKATQY
jgi:predicted nucleic acid-binding protein